MIHDLRFTIFKGTAFICLFLLLVTTYSYAQDKGFRGGIMFGAVASQVDGDMLIGYNKGGLQGGMFIANKFTKHWGIQIEMKYIQKGSRTTSVPADTANVNGDTTRYYKLRLSYIDVPFIFTYNIGKRFMLEAGLGFAYLFRVREDIGGYGMSPLMQNERPFNRMEFPFVFGVAFYPAKNFHIDFRYSYSILPIRAHPANQTWYFNRGQYNNLLSFGMFLNI